MSAELDLSDPLVREMADRNHTPREWWSMSGLLLKVACDECGNDWPCDTRKALSRRTEDFVRSVADRSRGQG